MTWPERKLSDDPDRLRDAVANPQGLRDPEAPPPTSTVEAPCCGAKTAGDMVAHVPNEGWLCDACRARLRRDDSNDWTKPKLMRAMGAPPSAVRLEKAKLIARERYIAEKRRGGREAPVNRRQIAETVKAELPEGEYPPGTEPPEHARRAMEGS